MVQRAGRASPQSPTWEGLAIKYGQLLEAPTPRTFSSVVHLSAKNSLEPMRTLWKSPTDLYEPTFSSLGPTGHVNLLLGVKVISSKLSDHLVIYKRSPTLQVGGTRSFPPSPRELLELSTHPIVTSIHHQYQTAGRRAITSKEGPEPGEIIVYFVVYKTISELERAILTTLFLSVQKTLTTLLLEAPPMVVHPWHQISWFCSNRSHRCRGKDAPTLFFAHDPSNVRELYSLRLKYKL
jgi:hypothetical protein